MKKARCDAGVDLTEDSLRRAIDYVSREGYKRLHFFTGKQSEFVLVSPAKVEHE